MLRNHIERILALNPRQGDLTVLSVRFIPAIPPNCILDQRYDKAFLRRMEGPSI